MATVYIPKPLARLYYDFGDEKIDREIQECTEHYKVYADRLIQDFHYAMYRLAKKYGTEVLNKTNLNLYGCGRVKGVSMSKVAVIVLTNKLLNKGSRNVVIEL